MRTKSELTYQAPNDQAVNDRIEALLARVAGVRRGVDLGRPIKFNAAGERHARSIAAAEQDQWQAGKAGENGAGPSR